MIGWPVGGGRRGMFWVDSRLGYSSASEIGPQKWWLALPRRFGMNWVCHLVVINAFLALLSLGTMAGHVGQGNAQPSWKARPKMRWLAKVGPWSWVQLAAVLCVHRTESISKLNLLEFSLGERWRRANQQNRVERTWTIFPSLKSKA